MRRNLWIIVSFAAALIALVAAAGCGGTAASTSSSPADAQGGAASSAPTTYLGQAQAILSQVGTSAAALPDAVAGLSKKPDDTWTASGAKLNEVASQIGDEASKLAALTPPSALKPVQDVVVKGLQALQTKVNDLSGLLYEQSATEVEAHGSIQSQVDKLKTQVQALSTRLSGALGAQ